MRWCVQFLIRWFVLLTVSMATVVAVIAVVLWCIFPSDTVRFKLTLTVNDAGEVKAASTIIEMYEEYSLSETFDFVRLAGIRGEGLFLPLSKQRNLVTLMTTYVYGPRLPRRPVQRDSAITPVILGPFKEELQKTKPVYVRGKPMFAPGYRKLKGLKKDVKAVWHPQGTMSPPLLAFVKDVTDPETAEIVLNDEVSQRLGNDIELIGLAVEVTDEQITIGLLQRHLPFLREPSRRRFTSPGEMLAQHEFCNLGTTKCSGK